MKLANRLEQRQEEMRIRQSLIPVKRSPRSRYPLNPVPIPSILDKREALMGLGLSAKDANEVLLLEMRIQV